MVTRDPDASFDTPNVVIGRQGRNELTLSFRPDPYLSTLLCIMLMKKDGERNARLESWLESPLGQRNCAVDASSAEGRLMACK